MSDLVGNPEDRFSHNEAHITFLVSKSASVPAQACFSVLNVNLKDRFSPEAYQIKLVWFCMLIKLVLKNLRSGKVLVAL